MGNSDRAMGAIRTLAAASEAASDEGRADEAAGASKTAAPTAHATNALNAAEQPALNIPQPFKNPGFTRNFDPQV
ncbi:hypothetical protein MASR1M59_05250 [Melaminivora sp.]|jgi:hypothetical protein